MQCAVYYQHLVTANSGSFQRVSPGYKELNKRKRPRDCGNDIRIHCLYNSTRLNAARISLLVSCVSSSVFLLLLSPELNKIT